MSEYNGWKNYATWNVALWLNNDEDMNYQVERFNRCVPLYGSTYAGFITHFAALDRGKISPCGETPDGVAWLDDTLDYAALNRVVTEVGC